MDIPISSASIKKELDVMLRSIVKGFLGAKKREDKDEI
tara:strand:- start:2107 stop:2220 length:114 start_codon:yes stop_codon:yes gene_type:complete